MNLQLNINRMRDPDVRDNFEKIQKEFNDSNLLSGDFKFFEITATADGTFTTQHFLGYTPSDVIQTSLIESTGAAATWSWNYGAFDDTTVSYTTSGIVGKLTIRAFIGRYYE